MKYPKLWNGTSAVGEALVRSLQRIRAPFLSAHTADGVIAGKMGHRLSEVKQSQQPPLYEYVVLPADVSSVSGWGDPADALLRCGHPPSKVRLNTWLQAGTCVLWEGPHNMVITANPGVSFRFFPLQYAHNKNYVGGAYDILSPEGAIYLLGQKVTAPGPVVGATVYNNKLLCVVRNSLSEIEVFSTNVISIAKSNFSRHRSWQQNINLDPTWTSVGAVAAPDGTDFTKLWSFSSSGDVGGTIAHAVSPPENAIVLHPEDVETHLVEVDIEDLGEGVIGLSTRVAVLSEYSLMSLQKTTSGGELITDYFEQIKVFGTRSIVESAAGDTTITYEALPVIDTPDGLGGQEPANMLRDILDNIHDNIDVSWATTVVRTHGRLVAQEVVDGEPVRGYTSDLDVANSTIKTIDLIRLPAVHTFHLQGKEALGVVYDPAGAAHIVEAVPKNTTIDVTVTLYSCGRNNYNHSVSRIHLYDVEDLVEPEHVPHLQVGSSSFGSYFDEQVNSESVSGELGYRVMCSEDVLSDVTILGEGEFFNRRNTFSNIAGAAEELSVGRPVTQTIRSAMAFSEVAKTIIQRCSVIQGGYTLPLEANYFARRKFTFSEYLRAEKLNTSLESESTPETTTAAFNLRQISSGTNTNRSMPITASLFTMVCRDRGGLSHDIGVGVIPAVTTWIKFPPYNTTYYTVLSEQVWGTPHISGLSQPNTYPPDRPFQDVWVMEYYQVGSSSGEASRKSVVGSLHTNTAIYLNFGARFSGEYANEVVISELFGTLPQDNFRLIPIRRLL